MKLVSAVLVLALALSGPLATAAWAQEKAAGQMAPGQKSDGAWEFAAGVTNVVHVPGKALLCVGGGVSGLVILVLTFGSGYSWAGRAWDEGCGGRWTVTAKDVKPTPEESDLWSEQPGFQR